MNPIKTKKDKGYQLIALDFVSNFSINKLNHIKEIYAFDEYLGVYNQVIRNHKNWNEIDYKKNSRKVYYNQSTSYFYNGFRGSTKQMNEKLKNNYINFKTKIKNIDSSKSFLNDKIKRDFLKFINHAKKNNIAVLVITPPYVTASNSYYYFDELKYFFNSINISYLNLNDYYNEINLTIDDFQDLGHLNVFGSTKTSNFLANYINQNYSLPNRFSDTIWKSSNIQYQNFTKEYSNNKKTKFEKLLDFKLIQDILFKDIKIIKNRSKYKVLISIDKTKPYKNVINNYALGFHIYPKKSDLKFSSENSKKKGRTFDLSDVKLNINDSIVSFTFNSNIKNLDYINMFLYDKTGYKGIIGKSLIIKDLKFK